MKRVLFMLAAVLALASCRMIEPDKNENVDITVFATIPQDMFESLDFFYILQDFDGTMKDTVKVEFSNIQELEYKGITRIYFVTEYAIAKCSKVGAECKVGMCCRLKPGASISADYEAPFYLGFSAYDYYGGSVLSRVTHFFTNVDDDGNADYIEPEYVKDQINDFWYGADMYACFGTKMDPTYGLMGEFKGTFNDPSFWPELVL